MCLLLCVVVCVFDVAFALVFVSTSSFDQFALSPDGLTSPQSNSTHSNVDSPCVIDSC